MATRDRWREHVEQWTLSGLKAAEYGNRVGVNPRTLTYCKWRLGRGAAWTVPELARLYAAAAKENPAFVPIIEFLLNTGCRKGEAIAAEWKVARRWPSSALAPHHGFWRPKSRKSHEVPVGDALVRRSAKLPRTSRYMFPNFHGERFAEFPNKRFAAVVDATGLTGGLHTCRHTYASHFLRAVPDLFELAHVLGHSHVRITELYTYRLPGHLERSRNAVNLPAFPENSPDRGHLVDAQYVTD
ncbi:MAG: tyrosine-type recombinase/integrase [Myxococcota bacterium]|nr:tyrosine-type recombinase/integrase [Myxococcota bacterium]